MTRSTKQYTVPSFIRFQYKRKLERKAFADPCFAVMENASGRQALLRQQLVEFIHELELDSGFGRLLCSQISPLRIR